MCFCFRTDKHALDLTLLTNRSNTTTTNSSTTITRDRLMQTRLKNILPESAVEQLADEIDGHADDYRTANRVGMYA